MLGACSGLLRAFYVSIRRIHAINLVIACQENSLLNVPPSLGSFPLSPHLGLAQQQCLTTVIFHEANARPGYGGHHQSGA